jgi:hypothetical protein
MLSCQAMSLAGPQHIGAVTKAGAKSRPVARVKDLRMTQLERVIGREDGPKSARAPDAQAQDRWETENGVRSSSSGAQPERRSGDEAADERPRPRTPGIPGVLRFIAILLAYFRDLCHNAF